MTTPQNAPVGKHAAQASQTSQQGPGPARATAACRWSGWSTPGNAMAR